jgi:predicted butyrate kinase (DUF1464 family)
MVRVAGTDPGSSSLDVIVLEDGQVADQVRFLPEHLQQDASLPVAWLQQRGPFDLIAGPSGYGLPLVMAEQCTEADLQRMALVRPDERGHACGVAGFLSLLRALSASQLPVVFLPGVIHLPTVPEHRKINRVDLGTADKLCVAALALTQSADTTFCVLELGSVFCAALVVQAGCVVDGAGGSSGPMGRGSMGAWDGEVAYLFSPLAKKDLFVGGIAALNVGEDGTRLLCESVLKVVAGLRAVTPFERIYLSGRLSELQPELIHAVERELATFATVERLAALPGAWVKHAAQGAALLADGLVGGAARTLVDRLRLREARGSVIDWLRHPRASEVRVWF